MVTTSHAIFPDPLKRPAPALSRPESLLRPARRHDGKSAFRNPAKQASGAEFGPAVEIAGSRSLKREGLRWHGIAAETVGVGPNRRVELHFHGARHLLVAYTRGARSAGETCATGLSASNQRRLERKLTFVPAGSDYFEWLEPHGSVHLTFFYIDPALAPANLDDGTPLAPRLLFEDSTLFDTALKLASLIDGHNTGAEFYGEALGTVLTLELLYLNNAKHGDAPARGGLAPWQQRIVIDYVEEHLAEHIALDTLAHMAGLSRHYFCRAFKQSLGVPPHRYHNKRRIERAKALLAARDLSVTEIGFRVGFSDTSSFSSAFRKITGQTPTAYLRNAA